MEVTLDNLEALTPCFASICSYIASIQKITRTQWVEIGTRLLRLLGVEEVRSNEYFRLSVLSLFTRNSQINRFETLARYYPGSDPFAKREILLAAKVRGAVDWLREFKEDFDGMDHWQKMAFIYCCRDFPDDETRYFLNRWSFDRPFDLELSRSARSRT